MLVKSPLGWIRSGRVSAAVCVIFLLGVGLVGSPVEAQSDPAAMAPWQASHNSWSESQPSSQAYYSRGPSVARPGDQIDRNINTSQLPPGDLSGIASPEMSFVTSDFWAQCLSFGLDYRF